MTSLRHRDPAKVGLVTLVLLVLAATLAFYSKELPIIGSGSTYSAQFAESAGLAPGNQVQVAGVKVGEVTSVSLAGNKIVAEFTVDKARVGDRSTASIEIKTLLGEKFIALKPAGAGVQDPDTPIPLSRTRVPYDIPDAINELTRVSGQLDTKQLADSFRVMSETFHGTPQHMGPALEGLSKLSQSIASRDDQLQTLLHNTANVSKIVADRNTQVAQLVQQGNLLLAELQSRKDAISGLLAGTQRVSDQLHGLVLDNQQQLRPALEHLNQVTAMLQRNQDNIGKSINGLSTYIRVFNNVIGSGRWFDGYLCGLLPPQNNSGPVQINPKGCEVPAPPRSGP